MVVQAITEDHQASVRYQSMAVAVAAVGMLQTQVLGLVCMGILIPTPARFSLLEAGHLMPMLVTLGLVVLVTGR